MKNKKITYRTDIYCEINQHGAVIPVGSSTEILENETRISSKNYPPWYKIILIWLGDYFKYPIIHNEANN